MRIALLSVDFPGVRPSGVGSYTWYCAQALAQAGVDVHLFTLPVPPAVRGNMPAGLHIHDIPDIATQAGSGTMIASHAAALANGGHIYHRLANAWILADAVRAAHEREPFDVVEGPDVEPLGLPLLLRPVEGLPVVTMIHAGTAISRWGNGVTPGVCDQLSFSLEFATLLLSDAVVAPTQAVVDLTRRFVALPDPVTILPSPLPVELDRTPLPEQGPVLFVGRLEKLKGCDVLARAANGFLRECPDATLRFLGHDTPTGPDGGSMMQYMKTLMDDNIRDRVHFVGQVSPEQMRDEYRRCRLCAIPSVCENFSTVAAEALACGRPVVYSERTGTSETVGDAGVPVWPNTPEEWAEALIALWRDPGRLHELSRRGLDRVNQYLSAENTVQRRIAFYESVIAQARTQPRKAISALTALGPEHLPVLLESFALLTGRLTGSAAAMELSPGVRLTRLLPTASPDNNPLRLWLYGAGKFTVKLLSEKHLWESHGHRVLGIIDDHPRYVHGGTLAGLPVLPRAAVEEQVAARHWPGDAIILSTDTLQEQFWALTALLRQHGIPVLRLFP